MKVTCIVCPLGCSIDIKVENDQVVDISGNDCKRGIDFAKTEFYNPQRMVTTMVSLSHGEYRFLPVISESEIPKKNLKDCIHMLQNIKVQAPIKMGDIVIENILGTGINIIAAKTAKLGEI